MYIFSFIIVFFSLFLSSCLVGPDFHKPCPPKTKAYTPHPQIKKTIAIPKAGDAGKTQYLLTKQDIPREWWKLFHSRALNCLIQRGLDHSPTLEAAKATLLQAQENLKVQIGALYPQFNLQMAGSRQEINVGSVGLGGTGSSVFNLYNTNVAMSYPVDIFGGTRRNIEAYAAQVDYQRYELLAAYLTLTSNIATTTFSIASLEGQIKATKELIRAQEKQVQITKKQLQLGGASQENVYTQEIQLAQTMALLPPLEKAVSQQYDQLAVYIGSYPSEAPIPKFNLESFVLPAKLPLSLPSQLVRQRPDVLVAEAQLHVASAQIGVATANLFPQLTINGAYGWSSTTTQNFFGSPNKAWSYGAQLTQALFHGGSLIAQKRAAEAAYKQAFAQYKQTVLQAFQNVADALHAIDIDAHNLQAHALDVDASKQTLEITRKQLKLGGASVSNVLTAEEKYQQAQINFIRAKAARFADTAALFQALGGGWQNPCN